jgi:DNA-binding transcriptional LysR family regulator
MVRARGDAMRELGALKTLKTGTLNIAAHESAAVYLLPAPLRRYLTRFPDVRIGIYRSPLPDIPRQVLDREVHVGFVKDEPSFHELKCIEVHADEMVLVAAPQHPLAQRQDIHIRDLGTERFVVHHLCSTTEQKILRLFEQHGTPCHISAELWSFENIKSFVQAEVGMAIVPRITVAQELRDRALVQIQLAELNMPRRTLMIYRDQGYLSDSARELIKIVRTFNWDGKVAPLHAASASRRS